MAVNHRVELRRPVAGRPAADDFVVVEGRVPEPGPGEALIRVEALSLDPYMGSALKGRHMSGWIAPGDLMPGEGVGRVVRSRTPDLPEGATVIARTGWQDFAVMAPADPALAGMAAALAPGARVLDVAPGIPPSAYLGVLGMPGLTAYAGTVHVLAPRPGETFVVSSCTGGVGSAAGQVAAIMGARVVGIAGSTEKCAFAIDALGFAACVDRTDPAWVDALGAACPDGVDAYFDCAGGEVLAGVMRRLALGARIGLCGMMDQYNAEGVLAGPSLAPVLGRRAAIRGIVVYDQWGEMARWRRLAAAWIAGGRLAYRESRSHGLESAPAAFAAMMAGANFGKTVVVLGG